MSGELTGKTVLITGGNAGIGRVTALELAKLGAEVVIIARNKETCETAVADIKAVTKNEKVTYQLVDLASFKDIKSFVQEFTSSHKTLDILINNAGVVSPPFDETKDGVEATIGINYLGHFYLTHLLVDLLVKSRARVVVLSSEAHRGGPITLEQFAGEDFIPLFFQPVTEKTFKSNFVQYALSNRARVYFAKELVVRHPELTAVSLHPGAVKTDLGRNMGGLFKCVGVIFTPCLKTAERGAETTVHCATADLYPKENGAYFIDSKEATLKEGDVDPAVQTKLWDVSMELCNKLEKK